MLRTNKQTYKQTRKKIYKIIIIIIIAIAIVIIIVIKTIVGVMQVWCRVLSFAKIYTTTCTYCWMFCEGFYLHQLITNTFEPPKSLTRLYLFGWRE